MHKKIIWIEGDGIGKEIFSSARPIIDEALKIAYNNEHSFEWIEALAGEKAYQECGELLPESTIKLLRENDIALKGPLATPVGSGFRSLTVTMRKMFDLYACIRPVKYFEGVEAPIKNPQDVNMTIFRENTEDVYAGIEYAANTKEAKKLLDFLHDELNVDLDPNSAIGLKPMTKVGSQRLIRKAINFALKNKLPNLTLVHKGNIMKYTEGAFREWGYELASSEFADFTQTEKENTQKALIIKDRIADAMFQEILLNPKNYSVLACPNLNGDYISDALAAEVGGLGIAPGVNMGDNLALFEATHGTAPNIAGQNKANPCSLLLSACMMFEHLGLDKAAKLIEDSIIQALKNKTATVDLASKMLNGKVVSTSGFSEILLKNLLS